MVTRYEYQEPVPEWQPRRVAVKFIDEFIIPYEDGAEKYFEGEWKERWAAISADFHGITLQRVYTAVSSARLKELVDTAKRQDPTYEPPNFLAFFTISLPSLRLAETLAKRLQRWEIVEDADVESLPSVPMILSQHYVEGPAEPSQLGSFDIGGIGASYAWTLPGGDGRGIKFIDIEKGWCLNHPDLLNSTGQRKISGPPENSFNYGIRICPPPPSTNLFDYWETQHGTSVLGILASNRHADGWQGIAPAATGSVVSPWSGSAAIPDCDAITGKLNATAASYRQPSDWKVANAIIAAIDQLNFGDVILLELQWKDPEDRTDKILYPIEYETANFESIRLATALGIVVVEAAGNGSKEINVLPKNSGVIRDSGAIIVGAAVPTSFGGTTAGARHSTSNFGNRVDCFAWGNSVYSLDVDPNTGEHSTAAGAPRDTSSFGGTSAAAAIVAGAAILLQGIVQASLSQPGSSFRLSALQMRNLLSDDSSINGVRINTASANPALDQIGVMPNLRRIIQNLVNIVPDIVVRDNLADRGDPHPGLTETSPDIIVRPSGTVADPQATFGGSATIGNPDLSLPVDTGTGSYDLYVRVFNRGRASAAEARATVYWTPPATNLSRPDLWNKIGTSALSTVPASSTSMTALPAITWPRSQIPAPDPGQNQYSFIATIGCPADPDPIPDHTALSLTYDQFIALLRLNNNISRRNFHVVVLSSATGANPPRAMSLPTTLLPANLSLNFLAPGAYDTDRLMQLEVVAHLPQGAQLWLEGPADFLSAMVKGHFEPVREEKMRLELSPYGVNRFREMLFPAASLNPLQLHVSVPEEHRRGTYEMYVRHLYGGEEVGRITWQLVPEIAKGEKALNHYIRWFFAGISPLSCLFYVLVIVGLLTIIYLLLIHLI